MTNKKIVVAENTKCPDCGYIGTDFRGAGREWKKNDNGLRVRHQRLMCNKCGRVFRDGEILGGSNGK